MKRMKKKLKKNKYINVKTVFRRIILVVLAIILGLNLYTLNASKLLGNQLPMPFGYGAAVVLSGSMEPAYHVGSIIYYHDVPFEELEEGNAITFKAGDNEKITMKNRK